MNLRIQSLCLILVTASFGSAMGSVYSDTVIANTSPSVYWDFQGGSTTDLIGGEVTTLFDRGDGANFTATGVAGPDSAFVGFGDTNEGIIKNGEHGVAAYYQDPLQGFSTSTYSVSFWFNGLNAWDNTKLNYLFGRGDYTDDGDYGPNATLCDGLSVGGNLAGFSAGLLYFTDNSTTTGGTTVLDTNKWYNVTLVRNNTDVSVYLNGTPEISATDTTFAGTYGDVFTIGGRPDFLNTYNVNAHLATDGFYDEVIAWNRALSASEVATLYEKAPVVIPDPEVDYAGYVEAHAPEAYWRFQESAGATVAVDQMGSHDLTLTSGTLGIAGPDQTLIPGLPSGNTAVQASGTGAIATVTDILGGTSGYSRDYTAEMWVKIDESLTSGSQCILYHNSVTDPSASFEVGDFFGVTVDSETSEIHFVLTNGLLDESATDYDGRNAWLEGDTALTPGEWYHVGLVREDTYNMAVYLNGQEEIAGEARARAGYYLADGTWVIGDDAGTDLFDAFTGQIDELAIYRTVYDETFFQERFPETPQVPGDANNDGKVDGSDVTILANNWQAGVDNPDPETITWSMGDFNGDGKVDGSDVTILANNWQYGVTSSTAAVPEPSTILMLITLAGGFLFWRRR